MKSLKSKIIAVFSASVMALSLTACGEDTAYIGNIGGTEVPAGIYLYHMTSAYSSATMQKTEEQKTVWEVTIDGKTAEEYIAEEGLLRTKKHIAIEKKFDELGLTLTEKEKADIKSSAEGYYKQSGEALSSSGIGLDSFTEIVANDTKYTKLFAAYYDEETGIDPVKSSEIKSYLKENYARIKIIEVSLKDLDGNLLKGAEKEKAINLAKDYAKRATKDNFDELIYENYNALMKQYAEKNNTEYVQVEYKPDEIEEYAMEQIIEKGNSNLPDSLTEEIFAHKADGNAFLVEGADAYYVVARYNILDREGIEESYKGAILSALKAEEFKELETKWAEELSIEWNEKAKERYAPKKLKVATK